MNNEVDHKAAAEPPLDCRVGQLPHDVARCCGYSYHHANCGRRDDCMRFNERDDLGFMTTNYLMAPDDCENGCGYLIPEPHH